MNRFFLLCICISAFLVACKNKIDSTKNKSVMFYDSLLNSTAYRYLLNNKNKDTLIRIWKLNNYGPLSLVEVNLNTDELRYYIIDKTYTETYQKKKLVGWYNSKNRNVIIRFFYLDSVQIDYLKMMKELKKNQADGHFPVNTSYFIQGVINEKSENYLLPFKLVENSYTDSIAKIIFTKLSWLEAISYYLDTRVTSEIKQRHFNDSVRPKLMKRKDYLIDSIEVVPKVKKWWWENN